MSYKVDINIIKQLIGDHKFYVRDGNEINEIRNLHTGDKYASRSANHGTINIIDNLHKSKIFKCHKAKL